MGQPASVPRSAVSSLQNGKQWFVPYLPITKGNEHTLFVHGNEYGKSLSEALLKPGATKIFLTGLHFMADFGLIRGKPEQNYQQYELAEVLKTAAKSAEIYLLVNQFWEREAVIGCDSMIEEHIMKEGEIEGYLGATYRLFHALEGVKRIHCRTDVHQQSQRWVGFGTNHQKTVVIAYKDEVDDTVCFLGGIDLTFVDGDRWDTHDHTIDLRHVDRAEKFWHDVHLKLKGPAVQFVRDNFHARWNYGTLNTLTWGTNECKIPSAGGGTAEVTIEVPGVVATRDKNPDPFHRIKPADLKVKDWNDLRYPTNKETPDEDWVQIVRSMPSDHYTPGEQKPPWNKNKENFERSCKHAYLVGIAAADKYIYLENQWVADGDIWDGLIEALRRNLTNPNFRIIIMIPQKSVVDPPAEKLRAMKDLDTKGMFGMYCLVNQFIDTDRKPAEYRIYVHSKIMIVDDAWSLIGSANGGGISLEGSMKAWDVPEAPDTELSAIILNDKFAKDFRKKLWSEHLGAAVAEDFSAADADRFRVMASAQEKGQRVRFAPFYIKPSGSYQEDFDSVKSGAKILCNREDLRWNLPVAALRVGFKVVSNLPPAKYYLAFRWKCLVGTLGGTGGRFQAEHRFSMRGIPSDAVVDHYSSEGVAYVPRRTAEAVDALVGTAVVKTGEVQCRVQLVPVGETPDNDNAKFGDFLLEYGVNFMGKEYAQSNLEPGWDTKPAAW